MRILTRYLARSHVGPFLFALGALTGLLFLNAVAQRLNLLVGKGLGWRVVGEFLLLSLPHTIALTLPMAVLIAVLYTFSDLTAASEITAMRAGGVPPSHLLVPMLIFGTAAAGATYYFNDQVLPEANHRLKTLMIDIANTSPTFELRDQVVNPIVTSDQGTPTYYLQATEIDQATNGLRDVTIFDVTDPGRHRTIYADSGEMAFNAARTDLYLTLHDGVVFETDDNRPGSLMRTAFGTQVIPLRGVADLLERDNDGTSRSDREMSVAMLRAEANNYRVEQLTAAEDALTESTNAVRKALGIGLAKDTLMPPDSVRAARAVSQASYQQEEIADDQMTRGTVVSIRTSKARFEIARDNQSRYWVEIHKKLAISTACIVFVLLGVPFGIRFPRGGVGMVISASVGIFGVYWTGLIGGENLADRGLVTPFWAMWAPNLIFGSIALLLVRRMGRETASMRGGGWDDLIHSLKIRFRNPARRGAEG